MSADPSRPATLDQVRTSRGELVLRRAGDRFEIISNGVFLMDTAGGASERLLVEAALARCNAPEPRLLIGGLGVGFSLVAAAAHRHLAAIDVVEIEPAVIRWHAEHLGAITGRALADPRVHVHEADLSDWLRRTDHRYDALCLDTDNGPNWLVFDANATLYQPAGLDLTRDRLRPGGVLAVWSASPDEAFGERLRERFEQLEVLHEPAQHGPPDVVYVAVSPRWPQPGSAGTRR